MTEGAASIQLVLRRFPEITGGHVNPGRGSGGCYAEATLASELRGEVTCVGVLQSRYRGRPHLGKNKHHAAAPGSFTTCDGGHRGVVTWWPGGATATIGQRMASTPPTSRQK